MTNLRTHLRRLLLAALLLVPASSFADAVLDWNEAAVAAVLAARQSPAEGARTMAMMHVAMFNAVNAIERRYANYGFDQRPASGASASAAAAGAARTVLAGLFPDQREALEKTYAASLQKLSGERGIEPGVALGEHLASDRDGAKLSESVSHETTLVPDAWPDKFIS